MNNPRDGFENDLLDAGDFRPRAEESGTLPSSWYFDPEIFRREHDAIFYRNWWYVCHQSDVAEAGDYFCAEVADQPVFVIRDEQRALRAFYNVCSHRAHPLLDGAGNTRLIVCPYHQWCYRNDGCFRSARGSQGIESWITDNADLKPVRMENYAGFIFVNLDPDAVPLELQARGFRDDMYRCCPRLDELVPAERHTREVRANWKTLVDNNHECYHCEANHQSLMELVDYRHKAVWKDDGITFSHTVERNRLDNSAYALGAASIEQESLFGYIWPNLIPLFFPGAPGLVMFQILPLAPERSQLRHDFFLLQREAGEQERRFIDWFRQVLSEEDIALCEKVQRGLHSRAYRQGRFVVDRRHPEYSEHHVHFFQNMVREALLEEASRSAP